MISENPPCKKVARNKLFRSLNREDINSICRLLKVEHFHKNERVIKTGEKAHKVYCIIKGNVEVLNCFSPNDEIRLGILTEGDFFGEMSFFSGNTSRTADIKAITDIELLSIDSTAFKILIQSYPAIMHNITQTAVLRLQDSNRRLADKVSVEQEIMNQRIKLRNEQLKNTNRILAKKNREIKNELILAGNIQKKFLPASEVKYNDIKINTYYIPCTELGGDICGIKRIDDSRTVIYGGDVSGHGASTALLTVYLKQIIEVSSVEKHKKNGVKILKKPGEVLSILNKRFISEINNGNPELYFTLFYAIINTKKLELDYSSAGIHCLPLIISCTENTAETKIDELFKQSDFPVGHVEDHFYDTYSSGFKKNDKLLFVSDGVIEVYNGKENFGMLRLKNLLKTEIKKTGTLDLKKIHRKVSSFSKMRKPQDDMCYFLIHL